MEQERDVVLGYVHVAGVDLGGPGHIGLVELFHLRTIWVVLMGAVFVAVADAEDLVQRLAVGKLDDGEVELAAADEVDGGALVEGAVGIGRDGRPDEGDFERRVEGLHGLCHGVIARPANRRGEEDEELVVPCDLDSLFGGTVVRRGVQEA